MVVVLVSLVCIDAVASFGRVHPGVRVAGVNVGGRTPAQAVALLQKELPAKAAVPVTVKAGKHSWTVKAADVGASFRYSILADEAMSVGRSGGFAESVRQRVSAWFVGERLVATAGADPAKLPGAFSKITDAVDVAPRDASLKVTEGGVTVRPSATGIAVDRAALARDVLAAFTADRKVVTVRATTAPPHVSDAAARKAAATIGKMIASPVTLTYGQKSWKLSSGRLTKMVSAKAVETSGSTGWVLEPQISASEVSKAIVPMVGTALGSSPTDARFEVHGTEVTIVPSRDGVGPDVARFTKDLLATLRDEQGNRTVALNSAVRPPNLTTAEARAMGIQDRISSFSTSYSGGVAGRANNIRVLGSALNGKLVPPGGTFSVNEAVGPRTAAKGYQQANAIVKGKLVPQMGGGICQVCTTMFNSVFMSGLPITERQPHSFYISHYPTGRDATVSWGNPDLKWKNTTEHWILVSVSLANDSPTSGAITISLFGTSPSYEVAYTTGPFKKVKPFTTVTVPDPTLPVGTKVVADAGVDGRRVVVTRVVRKGSEVVRKDTFVSDYTPKVATVRVGTKGAAPKTAALTTAQGKKP